MGLIDDTISPYPSGSGYTGPVAPDYTYTGLDSGGMIDTSGMYTPSPDSGEYTPMGNYDDNPGLDQGTTDLYSGLDQWTTDLYSGLDISAAWTGDDSNYVSTMFKEALGKDYDMTFSSSSQDSEGNSSGTSISDMLKDNPISKAYRGLDDQGKKFVWSAALGLFGQLMTSGAREDQRRAANKTADAIAKNAETNRLTYELAAQKQNNAMTSAGAAWPGVKKMATQYAPPTMINVNTRWSPQ